MLKRLVFLLIILLVNSALFGQKKVMIEFPYDYLYAGVDNVMYITAEQDHPVKISQITVTRWRYEQPNLPVEISGDNGVFELKGGKVGTVYVAVVVSGDTIVNRVRVRPIRPAIHLRNYYASRKNILNAETMKLQRGIYAPIINMGFNARCKVLGYEMIRISSTDKVERIFNLGGRFSKESLEIISKTESGDIYIFRKIKCQCPGTEALDINEVSFEIK